MKCKVDDKPNCPVTCPAHLLDKIQIRQVPNCEFRFVHSKIGKPIWHKTPANDFTFYDPHNRETPSVYNPLLDPYLKPFFMRQVQLNHLRKNNFITEKNEVVCSVKDFNCYRKILHRMKTESTGVRKRMETVDELDRNRFKVSNSVYKKMAMKNEKLLDRYQETDGEKCLPENPMRYSTVMEIMRRRKLEQECQRMAKFMTGIDKYNKRLLDIEQRKHSQKVQREERAFNNNLTIAKKQFFVAEQQRERQIQIRKKISADNKAIRAKKSNSRPRRIRLVVNCPLEI